MEDTLMIETQTGRYLYVVDGLKKMKDFILSEFKVFF